jgi:hypothetical protein
MRAAGQPTDEAAAKLAKWQKAQRDFIKQTGLKWQYDREAIEGFGRSEAAKAINIVKQFSLQTVFENSIINKNIEVPIDTNSMNGMSEETKEAIQNAIEKLQSQYDIKLDEIAVESLGADFEKVPFQYQSHNAGGFLNSRLVINKDYYFNGSQEDFTQRILRNYSNGYIASKNIEDLIAHEMAHVMTFQSADNYPIFKELEETVRYRFIKGVSEYADVSYDGAETIAEGFVRIRNKESIPDEVVDLVNEFIEKWRKD